MASSAGDDSRNPSIEEQLATLREQVVEERESRVAAAAAQQQQHDDVMQALARLMSVPGEERRNQSSEVENAASSTASEVLPRAAEGRVVLPVEVGSRVDQSGESGQDRDLGLHGESARTTSRRNYAPQMKISAPTLQDRDGFQTFQLKVGVFSKYHGFDGVLQSEPYLDVGGSMSREDFVRQGVFPEVYEMHLKAWVYFSTAFQLPTDVGRFRRSTSPGKFWKDTIEWYCPKHAGNQIELRKQFTNFPVPKGVDPIPKLYEIEDLAELMREAGMEVNTQTVLGTFVAALSHECYDLEIRELSRKQVFNREEVIQVIGAQWHLLKRRKKNSPPGHALLIDERGAVGGRGHPGGKQGGRGGGRGSNDRNDKAKRSNDDDEHRSSKGPVCYNCHGRGHFARDCTVEVCKRCGGRGHDESKCPSAPDEKGPFALLAHMQVELPDDDDLASETSSMCAAAF